MATQMSACLKRHEPQQRGDDSASAGQSQGDTTEEDAKSTREAAASASKRRRTAVKPSEFTFKEQEIKAGRPYYKGYRVLPDDEEMLEVNMEDAARVAQLMVHQRQATQYTINSNLARDNRRSCSASRHTTPQSTSEEQREANYKETLRVALLISLHEVGGAGTPVEAEVAGELVPLVGGVDVFDPQAPGAEAHRLLTLAEQGLTPGDAAFNPIQFKGEYDRYVPFQGESGGCCWTPGRHVRKVVMTPISSHTNRFSVHVR